VMLLCLRLLVVAVTAVTAVTASAASLLRDAAAPTSSAEWLAAATRVAGVSEHTRRQGYYFGPKPRRLQDELGSGDLGSGAEIGSGAWELDIDGESIDESASGDAASGDAAPGDAASGDAASSDAASGDAASGDAPSPPPPVPLVLQVAFVAAGNPEDYTAADQAAILATLGTAAGIADTTSAMINITAASVRISASFPVISASILSSASTALTSAMSTESSATALFASTPLSTGTLSVLSVPVIVTAVGNAPMPPSVPPATLPPTSPPPLTPPPSMPPVAPPPSPPSLPPPSQPPAEPASMVGLIIAILVGVGLGAIGGGYYLWKRSKQPPKIVDGHAFAWIPDLESKGGKAPALPAPTPQKALEPVAAAEATSEAASSPVKQLPKPPPPPPRPTPPKAGPAPPSPSPSSRVKELAADPDTYLV